MAENVTITYQGFSDCQTVISLVSEMEDTLNRLNSLVQGISPSEWAGDAVNGLKEAIADMQRVTANDFAIIHSKAQSGIDFYNAITQHDQSTGRQMLG